VEAVSKGAGRDSKQGARISRTPFDKLRTGFDTLLHYVPQLLRMLR
jgi:hypothetical protein